MTDKEIYEVLGIEEENRGTCNNLLEEFRELNDLYDADEIWLQGDYGIYCDGVIVDETEHLVVVK